MTAVAVFWNTLWTKKERKKKKKKTGQLYVNFQLKLQYPYSPQCGLAEVGHTWQQVYVHVSSDSDMVRAPISTSRTTQCIQPLTSSFL